nr:MAG TPA: Minor capsid protein from bacteriophage [Caudoviricetes sp.]
MNSIPKQVLEAVRTLAQDSGFAYAQIVNGALPSDNGISLTTTGGGMDTTFFSVGQSILLSLVLNAKHENQAMAQNALDNLHAYLTRRKTFPRGDGWQITSITTDSVPMYLDREQNNQWLYGSGLSVRFYYFPNEKGG